MEDPQQADSPQHWQFQVELQLTIIKETEKKKEKITYHIWNELKP